MIPACFSNPQPVKDPSSGSPSSAHRHRHRQMAENLVTCTFQTRLCNALAFLTLTWSKTIFSHTLTIDAPDVFSLTIPLYPSSLPFLRMRPGSKSIRLAGNHGRRQQKMMLYWDFARAEFNRGCAEPESGFYLAVYTDSKMEFCIGDRLEELARRTRTEHNLYSDGSSLLSRRVHVFGRKSYVTRANFLGTVHEIGIDCGGGMLQLKVDGETRVVIKRLAWKFRGNERIFIGGLEVEFFWDVFNWINKRDQRMTGKANVGHGVFAFQVGDGGLWPEMVNAEKKLIRKTMSAGSGRPSAAAMSSLSSPASPSCSSLMQWADESSECGRSSFSSPRSNGNGGRGFSLIVYAWRKD